MTTLHLHLNGCKGLFIPCTAEKDRKTNTKQEQKMNEERTKESERRGNKKKKKMEGGR